MGHTSKGEGRETGKEQGREDKEKGRDRPPPFRKFLDPPLLYNNEVVERYHRPILLYLNDSPFPDYGYGSSALETTLSHGRVLDIIYTNINRQL